MEGISRLLPADLYEAIQVFGADKTAETLIADLQDGKVFDCPKCLVVEGDLHYNTGMISIPIPEEQGGGTAKTICDVCEGYMKTEVEYENFCEGTGYRVKEVE